jgi:hypothetical protein
MVKYFLKTLAQQIHALLVCMAAAFFTNKKQNYSMIGVFLT